MPQENAIKGNILISAAAFFVGFALDGVELAEKSYTFISPWVVPPKTHMEYLLLGSYFFEPGPGYPSGYAEYFSERPHINVLGKKTLYEFRDKFFEVFDAPNGEGFSTILTQEDLSYFPDKVQPYARAFHEQMTGDLGRKGVDKITVVPGDLFTLSIFNQSDRDITTISIEGYTADLGDIPVAFDFPSGVSPSEFTIDGDCLKYEGSSGSGCVTENVKWEKTMLTSQGIRPGRSLMIPMFSGLELQEFSAGQRTGSIPMAVGKVFLPTGYSIKSWGREFSSESIRPLHNTLQIRPGYDARSGA